MVTFWVPKFPFCSSTDVKNFIKVVPRISGFCSPTYDFLLNQNTSSAVRGKKSVDGASTDGSDLLCLGDSCQCYKTLQKKLRWSAALGKKSVTSVPPQLQQVQFRGIGEDSTGKRT